MKLSSCRRSRPKRRKPVVKRFNRQTGRFTTRAGPHHKRYLGEARSMGQDRHEVDCSLALSFANFLTISELLVFPFTDSKCPSKDSIESWHPETWYTSNGQTCRASSSCHELTVNTTMDEEVEVKIIRKIAPKKRNLLRKQSCRQLTSTVAHRRHAEC
jgi:hypothetical protein